MEKVYNKEERKTASKPKTDTTTKEKYVEYTETTYVGSEFKTRIFKCTDIKYDNDGRVCYMFFKEQQIDMSQLES